MAEPIESVVRVATNPAQAKVFAAILQAEGIPARVEGDNLVDEFAASRRLMNLMGTTVMVPTRSLARANEILQPVTIEPDELTRQALAAQPESAASAVAPIANDPAPSNWWWALVLVPLVIFLFAKLVG